MSLLEQALRGANAPAAPDTSLVLQRLLVVGGGGALGSALLAEALVAGRFQQVSAVTRGPLPSTLRRFQPVPQQALQDGRDLAADLAVLVFERQRHANGRDEVFLQPSPDELLPLATALKRGGVRRLAVVLPHAPALLPQALRAGFASRDEAEVAALDFEQLAFLRAAQAAGAQPRAGSWLRRLADLWWSQMRWMVPAQEQPLRSTEMAQRLVPWLRSWPERPRGTRVITPDQLPPLAGAPAPSTPAM